MQENQEQDKDSNRLKLQESNKKKYYIVGSVMILILFIILYLSLSNESGSRLSGMATTEVTLSDQVLIEEYSDFQCPFCKKALPTLKQLKELYGNKIRVEYKHFPLSFHQYAQKAAEASECARDQGKFWEYHDKLFENQQRLEIPNLKRYANELDLDTSKFDSCLDNAEKAQLIKLQISEGRSKGVSGTPAFFIKGNLISGAQPIESFTPLIDKALGKESDIMEKLNKNEPNIEFITITDKNCTDCDTTQILAVTQKLFPKLTLIEVDVNSVQGKDLVSKYNLEKLPSYLFSSNVVDASAFQENPNLQRAFEKRGEKYKLKDEATQATRFIDSKKQAIYEAQIAKEKQLVFEKLGLEKGRRPQLDFFIMSYCPYGNQAEEAVEGAYQILGDKATFQPRYVIYENYRGGGQDYCLDKESKYCSMHGIQELNQNIRERCVYEEYGTEEFFKFTLAMNKECNSINADICWKGVAKNLGLPIDKISKCQTQRGIEFVKEDKELNELLGVKGSPTIFINGIAYNGARTSQSYLNALCASFDQKPEECFNTPETQTKITPTGECGT